MEPVFTFGAQYYRPPTPDASDWETDLKNMKANGMNSVRFWVLWRSVCRSENGFYFDDLDRLMALAKEIGLRVTLGFICDVMPSWLYRRCPDSVMVTAGGARVEPQGFICRQIGGFPGPCLNHAGAKAARGDFIAAVVERYKESPALEAWDVWCEPEQCGLYREPKMLTLTCYCESCKAAFVDRMKKKYRSVDTLNRVWGRCYVGFEEIELPKTPDLFADFLDFCHFKLDTMTAEAAWRIRTVKDADGTHPVYLHVVPNTGAIFNAVTCADDFALAKECDFFGSTNFPKPIWSIETLSAAAGRRCINAECHIGAGSIQMHQKIISYDDLVYDLVPQIGMGIRGFVFWQWRAERCGAESPAWGMTKPDGTPGSIALAAKRFIEALLPYENEIMNAEPCRPEIAVWKGMSNEIFAFASHKSLEAYAKDVESYINALYTNNYGCRIADDEAVKSGLDGVKLLIMPYPYAADASLAEAADRFVRGGGTLLCEAHFGGYEIDVGRHAKTMPGCGLAKRWGIEEIETTAAYHLKTEATAFDMDSLSADARKAAQAYGLCGGKYFPLTDGTRLLLGAERFAEVTGEEAETLYTFGKRSVILKKRVGAGTVIYCGTDPGEGAEKEPTCFADFLLSVCRMAGVKQNVTATVSGLHLEAVGGNMVTVHNPSSEPKTLDLNGTWRAVFRDKEVFTDTLCVQPHTAELYKKV